MCFNLTVTRSPVMLKSLTCVFNDGRWQASGDVGGEAADKHSNNSNSENKHLFYRLALIEPFLYS